MMATALVQPGGDFLNLERGISFNTTSYIHQYLALHLVKSAFIFKHLNKLGRLSTKIITDVQF